MKLFWSSALLLCLLPLWGQAQPRLVVADGSITEIVYALNAQQQLVAVDATSLYPPAATRLPNIGYLRNLNAEGILALQPDMLLTTQAAGPQKVLDHLRKTEVEVHQLQAPYTREGVADKVRQIATLLNQEAAGEAIAAEFNRRMDQAIARLHKRFDSPPRVLVFLGVQANQLMAAGRNTQAAAVLEILGWHNSADRFDGYKPLSPEALLAMPADVIIVLKHGPQEQPELPATFRMTSAARNHHLVFADSTELLGFGIRLPNALEHLDKALP